MKNSIILMLVGFVFIMGGLTACDYWILNAWSLLVPIGGFAIFVKGTLKFLIYINSDDNE